MKEFIRDKILFLIFRHKSSSERYVKWLRNKGVRVGKNTVFYSPWSINIDIQRPWLIEIGDNVNITLGVTILQHGYDWAVLQKLKGDVLGSAGKVKIGNNVFIGVKSTILKGVTIGDNVIIGANSLVNKDLKSNGVYAGNPAKFIMSIEDYYEKRKAKQVLEAKELVEEYYKVYNKLPDKELLREFFWLFEERGEELNDTFKKVHMLGGNLLISQQAFQSSKPQFEGYDEFVKSCKL